MDPCNGTERKKYSRHPRENDDPVLNGGRPAPRHDRSASNTSSETAEAGLFQTSFNARRASPLLPKECPFFAAQFAAIGLRNTRTRWGPINRREAEVTPGADALFKQVQEMVDREKRGPLL